MNTHTVTEPRTTVPDGIVEGIDLATGQRRLYYADQLAQTVDNVNVPSDHPPSRDPWPARIATTGGSLAAVLAAVGYAGPGLLQAGHAVEMAGIGVGAATAGVVLLLKSTGGRAGQGVNVSVNVTATGGRASASARSRGRR